MIHHRPASTYHDDSTWPRLELGPGDDRRYFEQLLGAILQAGLGWPTIESHGPAFSKVFDDFDPREVAAMTDKDLEHAAQDLRLLRCLPPLFRRPQETDSGPTSPPLCRAR